MLKIGLMKSKNLDEEYETKFKELHSKSINEIQNTHEYQENLMQIESIKKVLINNAYVPEKLVSWLIEAVKNNTIMEHVATNKKIFKYMNRR